MNKNEDPSSGECVGCGACVGACKQSAISLVMDPAGFYVAHVESGLCVGCGNCAKVCPLLNLNKIELTAVRNLYSCQALDNPLFTEATSGAFFPEIAMKILENGGVVYGVAFDENMVAKHVRVDCFNDLGSLCGSKYVQSFVGDLVVMIDGDLRLGLTVLVSGTPCQIAGVKLYLELNETPTENLLSTDVLCYGTPSAKLFAASIEDMQNRLGGTIRDYRFRDKRSNGWSHTTYIKYGDSPGEVFEEEDYSKIPYYKMFAARDCFLEACYSCSFVGLKRTSDFTIANFWNIETLVPDEYDSSRGVSMVAVNTEKGSRLFEAVSRGLYYVEHEIEAGPTNNEAFVRPASRGPFRDVVYRSLENYGFEYVLRRYYGDGLRTKIERKARRGMQKLLQFLGK